MNKQPMHPGLQRIHDLLYLDIVDDRDTYNPDKEWDVDMLSMIAEIVDAYIPRPTKLVYASEAIDDSAEPSPDLTVILTVSGGVADVLAKPKGVAVLLHDYDVDGSDENEPNVSRDPDGQLCSKAEWSAEEQVAGNTHWLAVQAVMQSSYSRLWRCPDCHRTARVTYEDLSKVGKPLCTDCDRPMDLL